MDNQFDSFKIKMIFFRVGWMENYQGIKDGDEIHGGGSYVEDKGYGHEIFNFQPFKNKVYGYVQPPGKKSIYNNRMINIKRIGATNSKDLVEKVLVVWVATLPSGGTFIVGWYKNATVYKYWQSPPSDSERFYDGKKFGYYTTANLEDAKLLSPDERVFPIPTGKGGIGQSNVWYADKPSQHQKLRQDVLKYIESRELPESLTNDTKGNSGHQPDPLIRQKVEKAAVKKTIKHFTKIGYQVNSVESDNLGWDLNAFLGQRKLKLEVKGLSGSQVTVELTPNEYEKMNNNKTDYRLCIVSKALTEPSLEIFSYSMETNQWQTPNDRKLQIEEVISAKCSAK